MVIFRLSASNLADASNHLLGKVGLLQLLVQCAERKTGIAEDRLWFVPYLNAQLFPGSFKPSPLKSLDHPNAT